MPTIRLSTEYGSKYNRELWDKATRSNYFQLVDDRRKRMLRASCHAPIHWEHVPEFEDIKIITPDPIKEHVSTLADVRRNHEHRMKKGSASINSRLTPPPKTAWVSSSSRSSSQASDFEHLQWESTLKDDMQALKRKADQRSPTPVQEDRKKLKTPFSSANQRQTPIIRPRSAPTSQLSRNSKESYHSGCERSVRSVHSRPRSAATSGMSLDYDKTHGSVASQSVRNVTAPFAAPYSGVKKEGQQRQDKNIPRIFERNQLSKQKSTEKCKLEKLPVDKLKDHKNLSYAIEMSNMPKDMSSWVTEYQGNFKVFKPF